MTFQSETELKSLQRAPIMYLSVFLPGNATRDGCRSKALGWLLPLVWPKFKKELVECAEGKRFHAGDLLRFMGADWTTPPPFPPPASIPISATSGAASGKSLSLLVTLHSHLKNEGHNNTHLGELLQTFSDSEWDDPCKSVESDS